MIARYPKQALEEYTFSSSHPLTPTLKPRFIALDHQRIAFSLSPFSLIPFGPFRIAKWYVIRSHFREKCSDVSPIANRLQHLVATIH